MIPALLRLLVVAGLAGGGGSVLAQQTAEVDYEVGRTIIDDQGRSIWWGASIDHERGILHVRDDEEPDGIMAFSRATGQHLQTYFAPEGGGPQELPEGVRGQSVTADGRLYVAGLGEGTSPLWASFLIPRTVAM
ncbi:MAG: hypothetical protein F4107_13355 [Gemmatimonadetes bacterium]|nr:hypothetical protein [Gemmatimonadota bacterium]MYD12364.1 hypothetical protein [Gemmatimonadota bacterium]MYI66903.1 hypothetical protein [Gemmatimonadota bacterium]